MTDPHLDLVVTGQVLVATAPNGIETVDAVGIGGGRVVAVGTHDEVLSAAGPRTRVVRARGAVVPGMHDFHLHLVGMARARRTVALRSAASMDEIVTRIGDAARHAGPGEWIRGDGWWTGVLDSGALDLLEAQLGDRPAFLQSHDHHSAWASSAALRRAGIGDATPDPKGGRIERDARGLPTGILRERAADLVAAVTGRLEGAALSKALDEVVDELLGLGFTSVTDAGDPADANGLGAFARLGDSFSRLALNADRLDGRLRVTLDVPAAGIAAAREMGLRTGTPLPGSSTLTAGWAKVYADGALGSRTAAVFEPYRCAGDATPGTGSDRTGILRLAADELEATIRQARAAGIALAIHAIGDRAAAVVVDALGRSPRALAGVAPDRVEHLQLVRPAEVGRIAALGVTASVQPTHCPSDRAAAEACWPDRLADAYPWRSLARAGTRIAFGSDAPIEPANPWTALHAAVHRRLPGEVGEDWRADQALPVDVALTASTIGPALASGRGDLGHLRPGAQADLAVLTCDLDTLLAADDRLAAVESELTVVGGTVVHGE